MQLRVLDQGAVKTELKIARLADIAELVKAQPQIKEDLYKSIFETQDNLKKFKQLFIDWKDLKVVLSIYGNHKEEIYYKITEEFTHFVITAEDAIAFVELFPGHRKEVADRIFGISDDLNTMLGGITSLKILWDNFKASRDALFNKIIHSDRLLGKLAATWSGVAEFSKVFQSKKTEILSAYLKYVKNDFSKLSQDCDDIEAAVLLFPKDKEKIYAQCINKDDVFKRVVGSWFVSTIPRLQSIFPEHLRELNSKVSLAFANTERLSVFDMQKALSMKPSAKGEIFNKFINNTDAFNDTVKKIRDLRMLIRLFPSQKEQIYSLLMSSAKVFSTLTQDDKDRDAVIACFPEHVVEINSKVTRFNVVDAPTIHWKSIGLYKDKVVYKEVGKKHRSRKKR